MVYAHPGARCQRPYIPVEEVAADLGRRHGVNVAVRLSGLLVLPQIWARASRER